MFQETVVTIMMFTTIKIQTKFIEAKRWDIVELGDEILRSEAIKTGGENDV